MISARHVTCTGRLRHAGHVAAESRGRVVGRRAPRRGGGGPLRVSAMLFTIRTLQGESVTVDLAEGSTVAALKAAMCTPPRDGWRSAHLIKVCCNGAVLGADDTLAAAATYLTGGADRFLVAIVRGTKPAASSSPSPPPVAEPTTAESAVPVAAAPATSSSSSAPAPASPTASASPAVTSPSPAADDTALAQLVDMGFERQSAVHALGACGGDVARAVHTLTTGGVESGASRLGHAVRERVGISGMARLAQAARASAVARDLASDDRQMAMLSRMPEVKRLLTMPRLEGIRERPAELHALLRRVLLSPELQRHMRAGTVTDAMLEDILRPVDDRTDDQTNDTEDGAGGGGSLAATASRAERFLSLAERRRQLGGGPALEAQLGSADHDAIARLMELGGFARARVLEAFLACDKDEGLAASLLFSQADGDDGPTLT